MTSRSITAWTLAAAATLWLGWPHAAAHASGCEVSGVVTDADGVVVAGVEVALREGQSVRRTSTDRRGRYRFVNASGNALQVSVVFADGAHDPPWFRMFHERRGIVVASDTFAADSNCERDFDFAAIDERFPDGEFPRQWWADAASLHRGVTEALSLSARLGVDLGREPLEVQAFYSAASPDATFWVGTPSYAPDSDRSPFIGLGVNASTRSDGGWPGNREFHEIGHHVLARAFGGVHPRARADVNHGGYWNNATSTDAWGEGFASFYATMVAKHVREQARWSWLPIDGAVIDLEADYKVWDLGGLEEFAVAGLLLDLEDGPDDYAVAAPPGLSLRDVEIVGQPDGRLVAGHARAEQGTSIGAVIVLELLDDAGTAVGTVRTVVVADPTAGSTDGRFAAVLPRGSTATTARLSATIEGTDDDPVDRSLEEVWRAIADFTSRKPEGHGRLSDVDDLYAAMKKNFGGRDADGDGTEDIQQLFIAHGLFADLNGDRAHSQGETVGQTGHPSTEIAVDGQPMTRPALQPRYRAQLPAGLHAKLELTQPDASVVVLTRGGGRLGVAYAPAPDPDGRIVLVPPPAPTGETISGDVTVVALASGKQPVVVATLSAAELHGEVERTTQPFLSLSADLDAVATEKTSGQTDVRLAWGVFVGGAVTLLAGIALIGLGLFRNR